VAGSAGRLVGGDDVRWIFENAEETPQPVPHIMYTSAAGEQMFTAAVQEEINRLFTIGIDPIEPDSNF